MGCKSDAEPASARNPREGVGHDVVPPGFLCSVSWWGKGAVRAGIGVVGMSQSPVWCVCLDTSCLGGEAPAMVGNTGGAARNRGSSPPTPIRRQSPRRCASRRPVELPTGFDL